MGCDLYFAHCLCDVPGDDGSQGCRRSRPSSTHWILVFPFLHRQFTVDSRLALAVPADVTDPHAGDLGFAYCDAYPAPKLQGCKEHGLSVRGHAPYQCVSWLDHCGDRGEFHVCGSGAGLGEAWTFRRILDRARAGGGDRPQCARGLAQG